MGLDETEAHPATRHSPETREDEVARCRRCGHAIARMRDRIDVEGRHEHTFVNPSAVEYRVACFREAGGAVAAGESSSFWSWFPGYAWTVALCGQCGAHLGWVYDRAESRFVGLIVDRLAS